VAEFFLTLGTVIKWAGWLASPLLALPLLVLVAGRPLAPLAERLSRLLDAVSGAALGFAMTMSVLMLVAQLAVVIARYVFGLAFSWLSETVVYSFAAMFLIAAASALRDDEHVRVDILRQRYGPTARAGIELAGTYLLLIPICLLVFWSAISPSFVRSWAQFEASRESDGLPILFLFRTLIPVFAALLLAQGLSQALKAALVLRGFRRPQALHAQGGGT
jgi:TRAP-type mannitol/chloroaromatic compound transport system permease small subunit